MAFDDPRSKLFFEYIRLKNELNPDYFLLENVGMKKDHLRVISEYVGIFPVNLNSNMVSAQNRDRWYWTNIRTKTVGLFDELYVDIPIPHDAGLFIKDILEENVDRKYYISNDRINYFKRKIDKGFLRQITSDINGKSECLLATMHKQMQGFCIAQRGRGIDNEQTLEINSTGKTNCLTSVQKDNMLLINNDIRRFTPLECARLQTVPEWYNWEGMSDTQRYRVLGNGWTINMIKHILSFL